MLTARPWTPLSENQNKLVLVIIPHVKTITGGRISQSGDTVCGSVQTLYPWVLSARIIRGQIRHKASPPKVCWKIMPQPTLAAISELPVCLLNNWREMLPVCSWEVKIRISVDSWCLGTVYSSRTKSSIQTTQGKRSLNSPMGSPSSRPNPPSTHLYPSPWRWDISIWIQTSRDGCIGVVYAIALTPSKPRVRTNLFLMSPDEKQPVAQCSWILYYLMSSFHDPFHIGSKSCVQLNVVIQNSLLNE